MINPNISVDCVVFGFDGQNVNVLLIEQKDVGQLRRFALPGDHLEEDEDLDQAAARVLKELTSLSGLYLKQSGAFGDPNRVKNIKDLPWLESNRSDPPSAGYYDCLLCLGEDGGLQPVGFELCCPCFLARCEQHPRAGLRPRRDCPSGPACSAPRAV